MLRLHSPLASVRIDPRQLWEADLEGGLVSAHRWSLWEPAGCLIAPKRHLSDLQ